jgi:uncharacterized protein YdeI (YjbR/CyaY-like superfamily)
LKPLFFKDRDSFHKWLETNHNKLDEAQIGFYKRASGIPSVSYKEAVDEALCFGWIDGKMNSIDDMSYMHRFTPRRPKSNWSVINIKRAKELIKEGRMTPAGKAAFDRRGDDKKAQYSYEQLQNPELPAALEAKFRKHKRAWAFFVKQTPSYQRYACYWIISAKREETKLRRLGQLIEYSKKGERHPQFG